MVSVYEGQMSESIVNPVNILKPKVPKTDTSSLEAQEEALRKQELLQKNAANSDAEANRRKRGGQGSYRQSLLGGLETGVAPSGGKRTSLG